MGRQEKQNGKKEGQQLREEAVDFGYLNDMWDFIPVSCGKTTSEYVKSLNLIKLYQLFQRT